jgi:hypothetical protein
MQVTAWVTMATAILPENRHQAIIYFADTMDKMKAQNKDGVDLDTLIEDVLSWESPASLDHQLASLNYIYAKGWLEQSGEELKLSIPDIDSFSEKRNTEMRSRPRSSISMNKRLRIYARDEWTCWLCGLKTSEARVEWRGLGSDWEAVLDHALPHSAHGTDSEDNLITAHRWCNSVRGNGAPMNKLIHSVRVAMRATYQRIPFSTSQIA